MNAYKQQLPDVRKARYKENMQQNLVKIAKEDEITKSEDYLQFSIIDWMNKQMSKRCFLPVVIQRRVKGN